MADQTKLRGECEPLVMPGGVSQWVGGSLEAFQKNADKRGLSWPPKRSLGRSYNVKQGSVKGKKGKSKQGSGKDKVTLVKGKSKGKPLQVKGKSKGEPLQVKGKSKGEPVQTKGKSKGKPLQVKGKSKGKPLRVKGKGKGNEIRKLTKPLAMVLNDMLMWAVRYAIKDALLRFTNMYQSQQLGLSFKYADVTNQKKKAMKAMKALNKHK